MEFVKVMNYRMELNSKAYARAIENRKLNVNKMEKLMAAPPDSLVKEATSAAERRTFTYEGELAKKVSQIQKFKLLNVVDRGGLIRKSPTLRHVIPFAR